MSRCFPYPPPGYTLSRARNEALIESIKLQKEKERKKEKREKRKENEHKRKEKREKRKEKKHKSDRNPDKTDPDIPRTIDKSDNISKSLSNTKVDFLSKRRESETEQFERSSLTEEHARPANNVSGPSTSSDSTENSNKRKRPVDDTSGKVILIRLPSKKQNEFDALANDEPCSTSGRSCEPFKSRDVSSSIDQMCSTSTSGPIKRKSRVEAMPKSVVLTPMQKMDMEYQNILGKCLPPQIKDAGLCSDDLDWLCKGKIREKRAEMKMGFGSDFTSGLSCLRSSGLWPRAEYLREVDVYALPYTVPY